MIERIKNNNTLGIMLLGIVIWGILWQVGLAFTERVLYHSIGLWVGIGVALFMGYNMAVTLEDALDLGESGATSHMRKYLMLRYFVACMAIAVLGFTKWADVVTCFAGILGLKISAYLEPVLARLIIDTDEKDNENKDEGGERIDE